MITIGGFLVRLASMKISEKNLKFAGVNTVPPGSVILALWIGFWSPIDVIKEA